MGGAPLLSPAGRRRAALAAVVAAAAVAALALARRDAPGDAWASRTASVMHTDVSVLAPADRADAAAEAVFAAFREVEATANEWRPESPLGQLNRAAGTGAWTALPPDLLALLGRAVAIARETGGAFDPTWAALWGLWRFDEEGFAVPDPAEVARRAALVGWERLELDPAGGRARLPAEGMQVGLGGIAKGHALDRAARALLALGVRDALLSAGGQVLALGRRGDRPWRVGIRDPRGAPSDAFAFLEVQDTSVSTSGDYERYVVRDGVRHHHILDPRTGRPARGLRSATVVSADATLADALSTAIMVLGPEAGLALAERLEGVEAALVTDDARLLTTPGLAGRLVVDRPPRP